MYMPFLNSINSTIKPYAIEQDMWYEIKHYPKNHHGRLTLVDPRDSDQVLMLNGNTVKEEYPIHHRGHIVTDLVGYHSMMTFIAIRHTSYALVIEDFTSIHFQKDVHIVGVYKDPESKYGLKAKCGSRLALKVYTSPQIYIVDMDA